MTSEDVIEETRNGNQNQFTGERRNGDHHHANGDNENSRDKEANSNINHSISNEEGAQQEGRVLYVANLAASVKEEHLQEAFSKFFEDAVDDSRVVLNPISRDSRGFAFVVMKTQQLADDARLKMDGYELKGRNMKVEIARRSKPYERTPGTYKGPPNKRMDGGQYRDRRNDRMPYDSRDTRDNRDSGRGGSRGFDDGHRRKGGDREATGGRDRDRDRDSNMSKGRGERSGGDLQQRGGGSGGANPERRDNYRDDCYPHYSGSSGTRGSGGGCSDMPSQHHHGNYGPSSRHGGSERYVDERRGCGVDYSSGGGGGGGNGGKDNNKYGDDRYEDRKPRGADREVDNKAGGGFPLSRDRSRSRDRRRYG